MINYLRPEECAGPLPLEFQLAQTSCSHTAPSSPNLAHHRRLGPCDRLALFLLGQVSPTHPTRCCLAERLIEPDLGLGLDAQLALPLLGMGDCQERLGHARERGRQVAMAEYGTGTGGGGGFVSRPSYPRRQRQPAYRHPTQVPPQRRIPTCPRAGKPKPTPGRCRLGCVHDFFKIFCKIRRKPSESF